MLFERIVYSCPSEKHLLSLRISKVLNFKPFIILFLAQVLFHEEVLISLQFRKDPHIIFWFDKDKHYIYTIESTL